MQPRKTDKADLEKKRSLFFLIGLCTSLTLIIIAFSWKFETETTSKHLVNRKVRADNAMQIVPGYNAVEQPQDEVEITIDTNIPEIAEAPVSGSVWRDESYNETHKLSATHLVRLGEDADKKGYAERMVVDRLNRRMRIAKVQLEVLHDKLIPEGLPEGMKIPLQEGVYTHTAPAGTYLSYLNLKKEFNELRRDSLQIAINKDRLKKYIDRQTMLNRIEMVRIQMKAAELNEKIAREEALKMYRPYGRPDNSVKVDATMITARDFADVLSGRVPGVQVSHNMGQLVIQIRASANFNGAIEPLYMLNGMPTDKLAVAFIPVSNISTIDILKSPEQTAMYGSRGAGGVINVITAMPANVPMTAEQLKKQEDLALSVEQRKHLVNAKGRRMTKEEFAAEWIRDHNRSNLYAEEMLDMKIYKVKWCACKAHYCNGWRMEYNDEDFTAWMKGRASAGKSSAQSNE